MREKGKRYRQNLEAIDREELYSPAAAVGLIKGYGREVRPRTVEVHVRTGLNVRHADQQLRDAISLPHGLGEEMTLRGGVRQGDKAREAEEPAPPRGRRRGPGREGRGRLHRLRRGHRPRRT